MKHMRQVESDPLSTPDASTATKKMDIALLTVVVTMVFARLTAPWVVENLGWDKQMYGTSLRVIVSLVVFIALGGARWLKPSPRVVGHAFRFMGYLIVIDLILGFISFSNGFAQAGETITEDAFLDNVGYITLLCVLVGLNEELLFRGLFLGGLLGKLGGTKKGILTAVLVSSVAFGLAHVVFDLDLTNIWSIGQGFMKTLQTGLFAVCLSLPVLEDDNLGGSMWFHGFNDLVLMSGSAFTGVSESLGKYVFLDNQVGAAGMIVTGITSLIYLPKAINAIKRIRALDEPNYGPFFPYVG